MGRRAQRLTPLKAQGKVLLESMAMVRDQETRRLMARCKDRQKSCLTVVYISCWLYFDGGLHVSFIMIVCYILHKAGD